MKNRTVVIIGVLDKKGSTNISQAKAFMKLGYAVIPVNYRTLISNYDMKFFENLLLDVVAQNEPEIILFSKCNGIDPEIVKKCTEHSKTWLWNMDPIQTIKQCPEVLEHAKNATGSSCTGGGVTEWFRECGVENCHHIFDGVDVDVFKPVEPVDEYGAEISFIGTATDERKQMISKLPSSYIIKVYGNGFGLEVINEEFAKVCGSSKYMLSINTYNNIPDYFSNRLLRYLGCGSCVLHYDPTNTINKYFEDGKELISFKTPQELDYKLNDLSLEDIGKIAIRGRDKVLNNYTWEHSMNNILERL